MNAKKFMGLVVLTALACLLVLLIGAPAAAFHEGGPVLLSTHEFKWMDPDSGGRIRMTENVYEGCVLPTGEFIPHDMTWEYVVENVSYDPVPGITNGFSGFQLRFPGPIPELYNQQSPTVGGPWQQNAYSGQSPPFGAEWDVPLPDMGIMPDQVGVFSFCTFEREDVVIKSEGVGEGPAGWAHTWGLPLPEPIVDADGTVSVGDGVPGAVEVQLLDPLTAWPTGFDNEGIDWFDNDGSCTWTAGDDIHVEGAAFPTALRDALHDDNDAYFDPLVLDIDLSLVNGQPVDVDLETGSAFTGCPGPDPRLKFYNANGATNWDDGEDIVLDLNEDFVFGQIINTQTYIFHGWQSVPGDLYYAVDEAACSDGHEICKKVKYLDDDRDGIIEVGEPIKFLTVIQVHNTTADVWNDVTVADRFGGELGVDVADVSAGENVEIKLKGATEKVQLKWTIGDLDPGDTANLVLHVYTDINPGGNQSYTSCSWHDFNSGAVLKFKSPKQHSFETGSVVVSVLTEDALGDCDEGGVIDAQELAAGTDPHDPADDPCNGQFDICIDADGEVSHLRGIPTHAEVTVGAPLTSWPTGFDVEGIDWFDNDGSCTWTIGDDIHVEGPAFPTAFRDAWHDDNATYFDPLVLDLDLSLVDGQQVDVDLETGSTFTGCPGPDPLLKFYDVNGSGNWDNTEDIVLDTNGNGVFD